MAVLMIMYCSHMIYDYYYCLRFSLIKKLGSKRYSNINIQQYTAFYQKPSAFWLSLIWFCYVQE